MQPMRQVRAYASLPLVTDKDLSALPPVATQSDLPDFVATAPFDRQFRPSNVQYEIDSRKTVIDYDIAIEGDMVLGADFKMPGAVAAFDSAQLVVDNVIISTVTLALNGSEYMWTETSDIVHCRFIKEGVWVGPLRERNVPVKIRVILNTADPIRPEVTLCRVKFGQLDDITINRLQRDFSRLTKTADGSDMLMVYVGGQLRFMRYHA